MEKLEKAEEILKRLELKSTHGNVRNSLKARLNNVLSECYNSGIDIEYLAVKYDIIEEINVYKNTDGTGSVVVKYVRYYTFKN